VPILAAGFRCVVTVNYEVILTRGTAVIDKNDINNSCLIVRYPAVVVEKVERAIDPIPQICVLVIDGLLFNVLNNSFHF
jgi:hypothetical protein